MGKTKIENKEYGGERPLFAAHDLELEHVIINPGESALKASRDIVALHCEFRGKYPFWHARNFEVEGCYFTEGARAALWYSRDCVMRNCRVEAPKMFRELKGLYVSGVEFPNAQETLWHCSDVTLEDVKMFNADYLFMHTDHVVIDRYEQHGNYSFQYCHDVLIRNAKIYSKDALWNTVGVTVRDSELHGEYLGWYSHGLRLVNCHITGTQPLCYCHDLVLENCTFGADADLAFEDSDVRAGLHGHVTSIKNPRHGYIYCDSVGEVILDENIQSPADCRIVTTGSADA